MTADLKHLTYEEYLALPEMKARYAIVDGALVMAAAPTPDHQTVVQETFVKIDAFVREHRLGRVLLAPLDIVIQRDPLRARQPDVMFISNARRYIIGRQVIEGGPDLVVEILSPANTCRELEEKLHDDQRIGVRSLGRLPRGADRRGVAAVPGTRRAFRPLRPRRRHRFGSAA